MRHHVVGHGRGIGTGRGQRRGGGGHHDLVGLGPDLGGLRRGDHATGDQLALEPVDRVALGLGGQLLDRAVLALGVGGGVRVRPDGVGVDQGRADAGADLLDDRSGRLAHLEVVGAVDVGDLEAPEPGHQLVDGGRVLFGRRDGDGEAVVGHDVQDRQVEAARRVERLPELALAARALAEADVGELVAVGGAARQLGPPDDVPRRLGAADGGDALAAGRARLGDDVEGPAAPVRRHLATLLRTGRPPTRPLATGPRSA